MGPSFSCFTQLTCMMIASLTLGIESPPLQANPVSESFVTRQGAELRLDQKPFYFAGANQYYLFYKSQQMVDEVLEDAARMDMTVIRTWAFCDGVWAQGQSLQPQPRVYNEDSFRKLDYIVYRAGQLGLKVSLALVNNWDTFGGMDAYVNWSSSARTHDDFYSDGETRAIFRDYINYLLYRTNYYTGRRYKDEPAVIMWELANEPRVEPQRQEQFYAWIDEMAAYIKSIDTQHLVSSGSEGDIATDFVRTHASPHIDIASFHLYPEHWNLSDEGALNYIRRHVKQAHEQLGKPIFAGEFGRTQRGVRDRVYQSWYDEFARLRVDGALVWLLSGHQEDGSLYPDYDGYTVYYPESQDTVPVIENYTRSMRMRMH